MNQRLDPLALLPPGFVPETTAAPSIPPPPPGFVPESSLSLPAVPDLAAPPPGPTATMTPGGLPLPMPKPPEIDYGEFVNAFLKQAGPGNLEGAARTMLAVADYSGDESARAIGQSLLADAEKAGARIKPPNVSQFTDIGISLETPGRALDWTKHAIGQAAGSSLPGIVGGVALGAAGKRIAGRLGMLGGGAAGAFGGSSVINIGDMHKSLEEEGVTDPYLRGKYALAGGLAMASLDSILPAIRYVSCLPSQPPIGRCKRPVLIGQSCADPSPPCPSPRVKVVYDPSAPSADFVDVFYPRPRPRKTDRGEVRRDTVGRHQRQCQSRVTCVDLFPPRSA